MQLILSLRKIAIGIHRKFMPGFWKYGFRKQKKKLEEFPEPTDRYERSYFQYKCQMFLSPLPIVFVQNILALIFSPLVFLKIVFAKKVLKEKRRTRKSAVLLADVESEKVIPESLKQEFERIHISKLGKEYFLGKREREMLLILWKRYWTSPYFIFKNMLKMGMYAAQIKKGAPEAVISSCEYSFTSSLLTEYCHSRGVEHINIMHGEKLFNIRDAFVDFDRFYVWDDYYTDLFEELRIGSEAFYVELPKCFQFHVKKERNAEFKFTYYLGGENTKELKSVKEVLLRTGEPKSRLCIRCHPRYGNYRLVSRIFTGFNIENPREVSLQTSLSNTERVVSLYSTVLFQAFISGKGVVIDDISNPEKYKKLQELKYIMLNKPHQKLSNYLRNVKN